MLACVTLLLLLFSYANDVVLMLISWNLHKKSNEVSISTMSSLASLSFIGQVTKHITVKWTVIASIVLIYPKTIFPEGKLFRLGFEPIVETINYVK